MRLSFVVPTLAGLLLTWGAAQAADTPPAAPIFYCPTPGKAAAPAPAATPAKPAGRAAHVVHTSSHRGQSCPVVRVAVARHHRHDHVAAPKVVASNDVSASQAFIYRYERAVHGLDAQAAEEAWAEGRHHPHHAGPPVEGPALAQRQVPPPPCPHGCPGPEAWRHAPPPPAYAQSAPVPSVEERPLPPPVERAPPAPPPHAYAWREEHEAPPARPSVHVDAWQGGHSGYRYEERTQESERAGGWRYSEVDGHGRYQQWGDHFAGEPHWQGGGDGDRHDLRYRCPPPVPAASCGAGPNAPVRHAAVATAGRDAAGYLTWPGKTE